ncbi:MAG: ExeA family protein [Deferribacterales bacterium]
MQALLKRCLREVGYSQRQFAATADVNVTSLNLAIGGTFPKKLEAFKNKVAAAVQADQKIISWLSGRNFTVDDIWNDDNQTAKKAHKTGNLYERKKPFRLGNPDELEISEEAEMLTSNTMKHFKIFRNPFSADISSVDDIFYSEDHYFAKEMILDTARNAGFCAIDGEVGCGKSVMRKAAVAELHDENIGVIYPVILDKSRITPASLLDAIIMDLVNEKPKVRLEPKTRQALQLLRDRAATGLKQVLIIEEAHLLDISAFKALKQISELEDGFKKLCGIVLIGQTELKYLLDDRRHEMREVTRRVTPAHITGMIGDEVENYLIHKFKRAGIQANKVFSEDAYAAFLRRLRGVDGAGRDEYQTYPLSINSLAAKAMNKAARIGEERVTADIVLSA